MDIRIIKCGGSALCSPVGPANLLSEILSSMLEKRSVAIIISALEGETNNLIQICSLAAAGDPQYQKNLDAFIQRHIDFAERVGLDVSNLLTAATERVELNSPEKANKDEEKSLFSLFSDLKDILHGIFLVRDLSAKSLDFVMSFGERLSGTVATIFLRNNSLPCSFVDTRQVVLTDNRFGNAQVSFEETNSRIRDLFRSKQTLAVVTGFIGATYKGETTTFGRGGSDYTAALFASALQSEEMELWTTVDGIMTADPRKVPKAITINSLSYDEAMELCHFGAKVIYPAAMQLAFESGIKVRIRNISDLKDQGSLVTRTPAPARHPVTGVSSIAQTALFRLEGSALMGVAGVASRLFETLSRAQVNIILISQASSERSICFAVAPEAANSARNAVEAEFSRELISNEAVLTCHEQPCSIIAIVGSSMRNTPGISGRLFQALGKNGINVVAIAQGSSELNISVAVAHADESKALRALHDSFFLSDRKTINIFLIGAGKVGKTLLEQIQAQHPGLKERQLDLELVGLATSKKMLIRSGGLSLEDWSSELETSGKKTNIADFLSQMHELNLPNSIFVDCTASDQVAAQYADILRSSISIITPNKRANSGNLASYQELQKLASRANVKFYYETTVGAGLPIIGTLNDLLASGDEIISIEAVLSGTLSFIFNSFGANTSFSEIIREAKEKGYTEPDPRDDLSGMDVARKLLILAREIGLSLELSDIAVENLVPEKCRGASEVEEFFRLLKNEDAVFEKLRKEAETSGKVLRYIGKIANGKASVSLAAVGKDHPFISLSGSDNIISFTTRRYNERPLVVKGPGAGTDVTAAGVLADILRAASYLA